MAYLIYLCSNYSHPEPSVREDRFRAACIAAAFFMQRGEHIFSPIAHSNSIAIHGDLPTGYDFWSEYNRTMLELCSSVRVLMLPNWDQSAGIKGELKIAEKLGKSVSWWGFWGQSMRMMEFTGPTTDPSELEMP